MRYTEEQYVESASIQARIIDELNTELKALKKVNETQAEQLILSAVSSSLPTKKYEIDFSNHLRCGIEVTNNELNILGAMDGWGNVVSKDVIVIKEL
jgi:hypothetical protein